MNRVQVSPNISIRILHTAGCNANESRIGDSKVENPLPYFLMTSREGATHIQPVAALPVTFIRVYRRSDSASVIVLHIPWPSNHRQAREYCDAQTWRTRNPCWMISPCGHRGGGMRCPSSSITESFVVRLCRSPARARNLGRRHSQVILGGGLDSWREERSEMVTQAVVPAEGCKPYRAC